VTAPRWVLGLAAMTAAVAAHAASPTDDWGVRIPADAPVVFRGVVNYDSAGMPGGTMLYPAVGGVGGFVAALITHGVILETTKNSEKARLQEQADRVLQPYQAQLQDFRYPELLKLGVERLPSPERKKLLQPAEPHAGWVLTTAPAFSMTPDQRALVLDNVVGFLAPGESATPAHTVAVRVVSSPLAGETEAAWNAAAPAGSLLKEESAQMLAQSLALATRETQRASAQHDAPFRSVRYRLGDVEKIERAQVVENGCDRVVVRTLRGGLLSVPPSSPAADCPAAQPR
jgi:hypothetical protein